MKSPIHKLKLVSKVYQNIEKEIKDFYLRANFRQQTNFIMESDDMLSIIIYLIIKSQRDSIYSHLKLIEDFLPTSV